MKIWKISKTASDLTGAKRHQDLTRSAPLHDLHQMQQRGVSSPGTLRFAKSTRLNPNPIGGNLPYINALNRRLHISGGELLCNSDRSQGKSWHQHTKDIPSSTFKDLPFICHSSVYHGYTKVIDVQDQRDQLSIIPTRERESDSEWIRVTKSDFYWWLFTGLLALSPPSSASAPCFSKAWMYMMYNFKMLENRMKHIKQSLYRH